MSAADVERARGWMENQPGWHEMWNTLDAPTTADLAALLAAVRAEERAACVALVQRARQDGETDLRQIIAWIRDRDTP